MLVHHQHWRENEGKKEKPSKQINKDAHGIQKEKRKPSKSS